ncbi:MAG: IS200/IS605 family transposase [Planctomycetota bacterium]
MATHQHLLYHIVFSTKGRRPFLSDDDLRQNTWAYIAGICANLGGHAVKVGGYFDHAHLLVNIPAKTAVSDFVGKVKANSSKHLNETAFKTQRFAWQDGFGAFTVSRSQQADVVRYIANQIEHHKKRDFKSEYLAMLKRNEVVYDDKYLWD